MLSFAGIGITELQYLMMTLLTLTGFLGQSFWLTKTGEFIPSPLRNILPAHPIIQTVLETPFKIGFVYFSLAIMVAAAINLLYSTTSASRSKLSILKQHIPFLHLVILCNFVRFKSSPWLLFYLFSCYLGSDQLLRPKPRTHLRNFWNVLLLNNLKVDHSRSNRSKNFLFL